MPRRHSPVAILHRPSCEHSGTRIKGNFALLSLSLSHSLAVPTRSLRLHFSRAVDACRSRCWAQVAHSRKYTNIHAHIANGGSGDSCLQRTRQNSTYFSFHPVQPGAVSAAQLAAVGIATTWNSAGRPGLLDHKLRACSKTFGASPSCVRS